MFFSEKRHRGPRYGMVGTQIFGVGGSFDQIPYIGPPTPLKIIAFFEHRNFFKSEAKSRFAGLKITWPVCHL
jgi:hypothetical protein